MTEITLTIRLAITNGMTVMRMALMNRMPRGSTAVAAWISAGACEAEIAAPSANPANSPISTLVVRDTPGMIHAYAFGRRSGRGA